MPSRLEYATIYKVVYEDEHGDEAVTIVTAANAEFALEKFREIEQLQKPDYHYTTRYIVRSIERGNMITYVETSNG